MPTTPPKTAANRFAEKQRMAGNKSGKANWRQWGPHLSERQWGTVREDYSPGGNGGSVTAENSIDRKPGQMKDEFQECGAGLNWPAPRRSPPRSFFWN